MLPSRPSMTPCCTAEIVSANGMPVGVAPMAVRQLMYMELLGTRIFMPLRSAGVLMTLLVCMQRIPTLKSSASTWMP